MASEASPFACDSRMTSRGNRSFRSKVVSIQAQAVKLHKKFFHFKYSLRVNKKNILGEYLRSLSQVCETIYTSNEETCIQTTCIETTSYRNDQ